ncbi:hypothetical protein OG765_30710 [Streptomyces sp. NBC_00555]|uniref:hypothetical protein n=1 Tax=Streptomyces sp. NBC_00555 TaxID=2903662 RepID=UPI002253B6A2|nr:hypothetical protein [Streptomyces sp. NBC_00555]MCX5015293.1 hypothetical protein [Streptomyces sp. NBC_00555]
MAHKDDQLTCVAFGVSEATDADRADALRLLEADTDLHAEWIAGLAVNSAAPEEVLRRVFTIDPLPDARYWLAYRKLSPKMAMAAVAHPDPRVREILAGNPHLPPNALAVLAEDPDPKVRRVAVGMALEYGVELPTEVTVRLATGPEARLRFFAAAGLPGLPDETLLSLTEDPDPRVRAAAIYSGSWPRLRPEVRAAVEADPDPQVRQAVERATHVEVPLPTTVEDFLAEADERRRRDAALTAPVDTALAALLATHEDSWLRDGAARNPHVPTALALALAADPEPSVRLAVSLRADVTEEQRTAIDYTVPVGRHPVPAWVEERFGDPDALREIAASSHILLRRGVTCAPELPADVIARLAADDDYYVRLMLCENDHAPHELLVEMFADWNGLSWGMLAYRRNFVRPGLARFADDPNHRLRYAALFDPQAEPELVEGLSHDTDGMVRCHAAGDPRLPGPRLIELLGGDGMPRTAAANPALPAELMHQLLDVAGVVR